MRLAAIALLLLAGCDSGYTETENDQLHDIYVRHNPIGRYQMIPVTRNGVGVVGIMELDTREGTVRYCQPKAADAGGSILAPDCSGDSERMDVII